MLRLTLAYAVTAFLAGYVPTLLFLGDASKTTVIVVGVAATLAAHVAVHLGLPYLVAVTIDGSTVFPVWAFLLGFPVAGAWKWIGAAAPGRKTEEDRIAEIRREAREKARRHARRGRD
jgi:hypothetical protein